MTARDRVISVLNHCLEWDKFVRLTLTYPTPDSSLTYTWWLTLMELNMRNILDCIEKDIKSFGLYQVDAQSETNGEWETWEQPANPGLLL